MKVIYPSFGRFLWAEIKTQIIVLIMAAVYVFFRWKFENHPHLYLRFGLSAFGAFIFAMFLIRWFWLVPKMIEISEAAVVFSFHFRERICFSLEDIDKYYIQSFQVFIIQLKNGQFVKFLSSPFSKPLLLIFTQDKKKGNWLSRTINLRS